MNRYIRLLWLCVPAFVLCCCQNEDDRSFSDGSGFFVSLASDAEVVTKAAPSELDDPLKSKFYLKVVKTDIGSTIYEGNYTETKIDASAGDYAFYAEYGNNALLELDAPYYKGDTSVTLTQGAVKTVTVRCKVANALTSVVFENDSKSNKSFDDDFAEYGVKVAINEGATSGAFVTVSNNGKSAYYQAGASPVFTFVGTLKDGGATYEQKLTGEGLYDESNFAAGTQLILHISMGNADPGLKVQVEKAEISQVGIEETIPLEWLPKPKIEASSAFTNNAISIVETETVSDAAVKLNTATALQELKLKFNFQDEQFAALNEKEEYLLSDADDKKIIEETLGITLPELESVGGNIDLTPLVNKLQTNAGTATTNTIELDAKSNNRWSSEDEDANLVYTLTCNNPNFTVSVDDRNCWSREFTIDEIVLPEGSKADKDKILNDLVYQYNDGSGWKDCETRESVKGRLQQFTAAAEDISTKEYQVRALYRGAVTSVTDVTATLETPQQLPNSDMEEWTESSVARSIITYSPWSDGDTNPFWQNNNAYTTRYKSNVALLMGSYPYNCFPAVSYTVGGHSGERAAEIRSTASGRGNTLPSNVLTLNKVAGELFTGNISVTTGGTAAVPSGDKYTINTNGREFTTRPTALGFWYKYAPCNSDTWRAYIVLMDADHNTISSKELTQSSDESDWKQAKLELNYAEGELYEKCQYIYIVFSSTVNTGSGMQYNKYDSYDLYVNGSKKTFDASACWVGSVLTIDDISLIYDK